MPRLRKVLAVIYVILAVVALVACWRQNFAFMQAESLSLAELFVYFWPALLANHVTTSITVDIFVFGLAVLIWMVQEGRRLGIRFIWVYVVLSFAIAISVMVPLFLAARERALAARGEPVQAFAVGDMIGLGVLGVGIVTFALWTLGV